jgi:hypothetical protein
LPPSIHIVKKSLIKPSFRAELSCDTVNKVKGPDTFLKYRIPKNVSGPFITLFPLPDQGTQEVSQRLVEGMT